MPMMAEKATKLDDAKVSDNFLGCLVDPASRDLRTQVAQLELQTAQQKLEIARQNDEIREQKLEIAKLQMLCESVSLQLEGQKAAQLHSQRDETRNRSIAALGNSLCTSTSMALRKDTLTKLDLSNKNLSGGQIWLVADLLASSVSLKVSNLLGNKFDEESAEQLVEAVHGKDIALCGIEADQTTIDFSRKHLRLPEAVLLASDLSKAGVSGSLTQLDVNYNDFGEEGTKVLTDAIRANNSLKSLSLLANDFNDATVASLLKIKEDKPDLTTLCGLEQDQKDVNFDGWGLNAESTKILAPEVVASDTIMQVNLDGFSLPVKELKGITPIESLNFSGRAIGPASTVIIGALISINSRLTKLSLVNNDIATEGAKPLAAALLVNDTIKELNLDGFALPVKALKGTEPVPSLNFAGRELGVASAVIIGALVGVNSTLTSLNLSENSIGGAGVKPLAEALHINTTLEDLNMCLNEIGPEGSKPLADALLVNSTLRTLNISFNRLCGVNTRGEGSYTKAGIETLAAALRVKCSLTKLDMSYNHMDGDGNAGVQLMREATEGYEEMQLFTGCNTGTLTNKQKFRAAGLAVMATRKMSE